VALVGGVAGLLLAHRLPGAAPAEAAAAAPRRVVA